MEILFRLANLFRTFMVDRFVPFMTSVPDGIDIFYFTFSLVDGVQVRSYSLPWLFGSWTPAEFILVFGRLGFIGVRLFKVLFPIFPKGSLQV